MPKPRLHIDGPAPVAALRPSEYTSALIQVLRARAACVRGADALEVGSGSGVVLAALGSLGAASLCGIDIENEAVVSGALLLRELGYGDAQFHQGDMWRPVVGRRFDLGPVDRFPAVLVPAVACELQPAAEAAAQTALVPCARREA